MTSTLPLSRAAIGLAIVRIAVGVICLIGIGILSAVKKTPEPRGPNTTGTTNTPGNPPRY